MIRELAVSEALVITGGDPNSVFPEGGWVVNCESDGSREYARIVSGTEVSGSGEIISGAIIPVTETQYAYQLYREGERETGQTFPVTVSFGC
jgi:hypothetical protein